LKIAFIGDIVGRPGRGFVKKELQNIIKKHNIDFVIANGENASHGFGLTTKNCDELLKSGIDIITGGNHTWDKKKDILQLLETKPVIRAINYPDGIPGMGIKKITINNNILAVINLMGLFAMPQVLNPFTYIIEVIEQLQQEGICHIFIDFHAESTAEKRILMQLLKGKVSAICGTHTHIGTDDLEITDGTFYVTDVGLTGCRDNVIGMDSKIPIQKALTGLGGHFDVPNNCNTIFQFVVIELDNNGKAINGFKLKQYNNKEEIISSCVIN